jgi:large subunit ribosomal protein L18
MRTQLRRRRESKTDYKARRNLLKSGKNRIVIRKTNKYVIAQAVESVEAKDRVLKCVSSRDLLKQGWDKNFEGSLKSIPACYLTGKLLAKEIGNGEFIIDFGMGRTIAGNRLFAVVKGLIDGGLDIKVDEKIFPSEERLKGEHLKDELKATIEKVNKKLD